MKVFNRFGLITATLLLSATTASAQGFSWKTAQPAGRLDYVSYPWWFLAPNSTPAGSETMWDKGVGTISFSYSQPMPGGPPPPSWTITSCKVEIWRFNNTTGVLTKVETITGTPGTVNRVGSTSAQDLDFTRTAITNAFRYMKDENVRVDVIVSGSNASGGSFTDSQVWSNYKKASVP